MVFATTERLVLRSLRDEDVEPMMRTWGDPEMTRYTTPRPDVRAFLLALVAEMQRKKPGEIGPSGPWYQLVVERRSDGAHLGDVGVGFGVPGERQAELGYRIHPDHQRQGYAREAVAAVVSFLIEQHDLHRFVAVAAAPNVASIGVLRALGFRQEGYFRESFLSRGEWLDDVYYALLARDWPARAPA